jgi:predicted DNA-binding protein with PD1-like motif
MFTKIHILRVKPGEDLFQTIFEFCEKRKITSAVILSLLGSLSSINLGILKKLPGKFISKKIKGPLEIGCGTGTIATKGGKIILHIHLVISDEKKAVAGHLIEGKIFSTAEVIIGEIKEKLVRYKDKFTGLNELKSMPFGRQENKYD